MSTFSAYKPLIIFFSLLLFPLFICALGVLSNSEIGKSISLVSICLIPIGLVLAVAYYIRFLRL